MASGFLCLSKYVQYFNTTYQRTGSLWGGRYRATVVDSAQYLLLVMRYIELNPVRAGLTAHPRDYPWSSYARNAQATTGANSDWIKPHPQYLRIARSAAVRLSGYRALFMAGIGKSELAQIRDCTHKGWALGGDKFKAEIEKRAQRQASSKGVGRPRVIAADYDNRERAQSPAQVFDLAISSDNCILVCT
jgi:putative transposase